MALPPLPSRNADTSQWIWLVIMLLLLLWLAFNYLGQVMVDEVSYSEFKALVREGRIEEVTLGQKEVEGFAK